MELFLVAIGLVGLLGAWRSLPKARVVALQSCDPFEGYTEMERIASAQEVSELLAKHHMPDLAPAVRATARGGT